MLDDIIEIGVDLLGDILELVIKTKRRTKKKAKNVQPKDPWEHTEPPPPWEK